MRNKSERYSVDESDADKGDEGGEAAEFNPSNLPNSEEADGESHPDGEDGTATRGTDTEREQLGTADAQEVIGEVPPTAVADALGTRPRLPHLNGDSPLPFIYDRSEVTGGRQILSVYVGDRLQSDLRSTEVAFNRVFSADDVADLDVRAAVLAIGLQHLDEVQTLLEAWGYGARSVE